MLLEVIEGQAQRQEELPDGMVTLGGGANDRLRVAGLPTALVKIRVDAATMSFTAAEAVEVDDIFFPPNVSRLLLPGESVRLGAGVSFRRPPAPPSERNLGTAWVARGLLALEAPVQTRAASLFCLAGVDVGRRLPIAFSDGAIGRAFECGIRLRDRAVSRQHARLTRERDRYFLEDARGPNGVYVNGKKVCARRELMHGDLMELGYSVLRFEGPVELEIVPNEQAAPTASNPTSESRPKRRLDWVLIIAGGILAILGAIVSFGLVA